MAHRAEHVGRHRCRSPRPGAADTATTTCTYNPRGATPALGGRRNSTEAGQFDNAPVETRDDVIVFTSESFGESLDIIGIPHIEVSVSVDNPHADLFVRLCDVDENGMSTNFADGIRRLDPNVTAGRRQTVSLDLDPCARRIQAGHRLRLQIAGGAHPRFARNLGTGEPPEHGTTTHTTRHTIHHDDTKLTLPVEN
nr:CocE/NonD family hydrolase [Pseudonocardia spinosispora]